jgi:hypothetical protein
LIELIQNNVSNPVQHSAFPKSLGGPLSVLPQRNVSSHSRELRIKSAIHFSNILKYILGLKEKESLRMTDRIIEFEDGFQKKSGKWSEIIVPPFDYSQLHNDSSYVAQ